MALVIAGMTVSLDGFVADRHGDLGVLYPDFEALLDSAEMRAFQVETGAVLMGRRTFEMADDPDSYADDYEFQVPIFVVTHTPPDIHPRENEHLTITFVTDGVPAAVERARAAAGDGLVQAVGGPELIGAMLKDGLVDELHVDVMPILLGSGTRFLDDPALEGVRLEKVRIEEVGQRTGLRFRVVR